MKRYFFILSCIFILTVFLVPVKVLAVTCAPGVMGNYATSTNGSCSFAGSVNGVDSGLDDNNAVLTVSAGTVLTIQPNQSIGAGSIKIETGGVIYLPSDGTGVMKPGTKLWYLDADGDGYPGNTTPVAATSQPTGYVRKNAFIATASADCYDTGTNAANVHPNQTSFFTSAYDTTKWDYDCDGATTFQYQTCACGTCGDGCSASPNCINNTAIISPSSNTNGIYTCSVAMVPGPGTCSRVNDGYGTCIACNNGANGSYPVGCR
jgi:hypothetical protein